MAHASCFLEDKGKIFVCPFRLDFFGDEVKEVLFSPEPEKEVGFFQKKDSHKFQFAGLGSHADINANYF